MIIGINKAKKGGGQNLIKSQKSRAVISGGIIEIYHYDKAIISGYKCENKGRSAGSASPEMQKLNRQKTLEKASRDVRRLINTNMSDISKFVTLTFADNVKDLCYANSEFKNFVKRLSYKIGVKVSYVAVVEYQKRGAIHYHCVMFNVPYISNRELAEIWGNGFVKINTITQVDNLGAYVSKYMTKDNDDERLKGKKCYMSSRGLQKPYEINEDKQVKELADSLPAEKKVYDKKFENDYNTVLYSQYNMRKK